MFGTLFLIGYVLYEECLVRFLDQDNFFGTFGLPVIFIILSSIVLGCSLSLIGNLPKNKTISRLFVGIVLFLLTVYAGVQHCCMNFFTSYYSISMMFTMSGQVALEFTDTLFSVVKDNLLYICLDIFPFCLYCMLFRKIFPRTWRTYIKSKKWKKTLAAAATAQLIISLLGFLGPTKTTYRTDYDVNYSIPEFGLCTTARLELEYALFGKPQIDESALYDTNDIANGDVLNTETEAKQYNILDIDFDSLISNSQDKSLTAALKFFKNKSATKTNKYTGVFKDKNLIMICAEAFCPYWVNETATPALYKLIHEGFEFNNFYQPLWGQSTSGGEYSFLLGNIPTTTRKNGIEQMAMSGGYNNYWPYSLPKMLGPLGYKSIAWHNNIDTVYDRNLTHPNLGYEFHGTNSGLDIKTSGWKSDLDMMRLTAPSYINDYLTKGKKFNVYYMSVSGHGKYSWDHAMAKKNRDVINKLYPDYSENTKAYIAASFELELALEYLLDELETTGIADDTVICMVADHYPYILLRDGFYHELSGFADYESTTDTYRNSLILWCGDGTGSGEKVDTPCGSIDVLPTILNMFGLDFDSRLIMGKDIFSENQMPFEVSSDMHIAIIPTSTGRSWRTEAGVYETRTKTFYPNPGVSVSSDYVEKVNNYVSIYYKYAAYILDSNLYGFIKDKLGEDVFR